VRIPVAICWLTLALALALALSCAVQQERPVGMPPTPADEGIEIPSPHLIQQLTLAEATAKLESHSKHEEALSLSAAFREGDSIWYYCLPAWVLDATYSPERGFALVRANSTVVRVPLYPSVPVESLSLGDCSWYPYEP